MASPKVSVIVPVYNVERYLAQCLDSVLGQTCGDFELICVNDGSTDASRGILGDYGRADARVRVIDKANGGLSSARNAGLDAARGDYVAFLDSDDWWDRTMLERTVRAAEDADADLVIFDYWEYYEDTGAIGTYRNQELFGELGAAGVVNLEARPELARFVGAWDRLFKRSFLESRRFRFAPGILYEDVPFCVDTLIEAERIVVLADHLQYYRRNVAQSITGREGVGRKHKEDFLAVQAYAQSRYREAGASRAVWQNYAWYFMEYAMLHMRHFDSYPDFRAYFACVYAMACPPDDEAPGSQPDLTTLGQERPDPQRALFRALLGSNRPLAEFRYLTALNKARATARKAIDAARGR